MDALKTITKVYRALHLAAPGTDVGKRWLLDMASWAVFILLERCSRSGRQSAFDEAVCLCYGAIVGVGVRAQSSEGAQWLTEQLANAASALEKPSVRERGDVAAREFALTAMSEADRKAAADLSARWAQKNAASRADVMPQAVQLATEYVRSSGCFTTGTLRAAELPIADRQKFADKVRSSIARAVPYHFARGEMVGAALLAEWLKTNELDTLLTGVEPVFDDSFLAAHELASEDAEDAANFERHAHEEQRVRADVLARTGTWD